MSYPTLFEKMRLIDEDFKKSPLYNMPDLPDTKEKAGKWFEEVIKNANIFQKRWNLIRKDGASSMIEALDGDYAKVFAYYLLHDYVNALERKYKEKFFNDK